MRSGVYVFDNVQVESNGELFIDSTDGPVQIYIQQGFTFRGLVRSATLRDPELFFGYMGTQTVYVEASYMGIVVAPNAQIRLQAARPEGHTGAFYGSEVHLEPDIKVRKPTFDWADVVGDGIVLPPLPTEAPHVMPGSPADVSLTPSDWRQGSPSGTVSWNAPADYEFELRDEFEVDGGVIGNGSMTLSFVDSSGSTVNCTYHGQSPTDQPQTKLELAQARLLSFVGCSDGGGADLRRSASSFTMTATGIANYPLALGTPITKDGRCSENIPLLTGAATASMRDSFSWENAQPVTEFNADGTPTLFYAWVYIRDEEELASYRKLLIHQLNRPLFNDELDAHAGKCGTVTNPGDGEGAFLLSLIPGAVYNRLIDALSTSEVDGDRVLFDAVILREVPEEVRADGGSISYTALAQSGFHYMNVESPEQLVALQEGLQLEGRGGSKALLGVFAWIANRTKDIGKAILEGLGAIDELTGRVNTTVWISEMVSDPVFDLSRNDPMIRAWGTHRGQPLAANDMRVTVLQKAFNSFIPSESNGRTDMDGQVAMTVAADRLLGG